MCIMIQDYISQFGGRNAARCNSLYIGRKTARCNSQYIGVKLLVVTARDNSQISLKKKTTLKLNTKWRYKHINSFLLFNKVPPSAFATSIFSHVHVRQILCMLLTSLMRCRISQLILKSLLLFFNLQMYF